MSHNIYKKMTPKTSYKFTYKTRKSITQEEIDNLPPPPQDWLDDMAIELRKTKIAQKTDIKLSWEQFRQYDYDTQLSIRSHLGAIVEQVFDYCIDRGGSDAQRYYHLREWDSLCSKLMTQKRPVGKTKYYFELYINHMRMALHDRKEFYYPPTSRGGGTSPPIFESQKLENIYTDEMIEELCWTHLDRISTIV